MSIVENADLKLSVTIFADEENDLLTLLREVVKEIIKGNYDGNVGGCLGTAYFNVSKPDTRNPTLRAADPPEQKCPECDGRGGFNRSQGATSCEACEGTGISNRSGGS